MKHTARVVLALGGMLVTFGACASSPTEDGRDDSFVADGKGDTGGISEGSPEAIGVLRVANELTKSQLSSAGVAAKAADNIYAVRLGDDETINTSDDGHFDTLAELDAVPYVGPVAFGKLLDYAQSHGWVSSTTTTTSTPSPACTIASDPCWTTCDANNNSTSTCKSQCGTATESAQATCWETCAANNNSTSTCAGYCGSSTSGGQQECWIACAQDNNSVSTCKSYCGGDTECGSAACWQACDADNNSTSTCASYCGTNTELGDAACW